MSNEDLWHAFPRTLPEFEKRFSSEDACRDYLIQVRWGGTPRCGSCSSEELWLLKKGLWECRRCGFQTSLLTNTPFERSRKPLRLWFRAIWEVVTRKSGVSGKDLQRILGFGSYETAWTWLHKIRGSLVRSDRDSLRGSVQVDEGYLGGKGEGNQRGRCREVKEVIVVAAEPGGRLRLEHAPDVTEGTIRSFLERNVTTDSAVTTDGSSSYTAKALSKRTHEPIVQTKADRESKDALQHCHWAISNLKRWWLGTHHGAVSDKHLQAYLDEFEFRHNRRKTEGVGRLVARVLENLVRSPARTMREIVRKTEPYSRFVTQPEARG